MPQPDPKEAESLFRQHLRERSDEEFQMELELAKSDVEPGIEVSNILRGAGRPPIAAQALALPHVAQREFSLTAYIACALSNVSEDERAETSRRVAAVKYVCEEEGIEPYFPGDYTDPQEHAHVPAYKVFEIDRTRVKRSDLLVWVGPHPSTGVGQELDIAYNSLIPIVLLYPENSPISRMVRGIPGTVVEIAYGEEGDVGAAFQSWLITARGLLYARRVAFSDLDENIVGEKIRLLRRLRGMSRKQLADSVGISEDAVVHIEESPDRESDPSLTQLRRIAAVLGTTAGALVEASLGSNLIAAVREWIEVHEMVSAARARSPRDQGLQVQRFLLQVCDRLAADYGNIE
ncbi:MAG: helix-turn-helix domain-containing protein [Gemmatimonadaceae bacterium]